MADGAMEEVNEWAYGQFEEALLEEDEEDTGQLMVNLKIVEKLKTD